MPVENQAKYEYNKNSRDSQGENLRSQYLLRGNPDFFAKRKILLTPSHDHSGVIGNVDKSIFP